MYRGVNFGMKLKWIIKYLVSAYMMTASVVLVVTVPDYRSRGPSSIPGATRFSEEQWFWNGVHSAS
jgi:hypothetical protein